MQSCLGALRAARKASGVACALGQQGQQDRPPVLTYTMLHPPAQTGEGTTQIVHAVGTELLGATYATLHIGDHAKCTQPSSKKICLLDGLRGLMVPRRRHTPAADGEAALRCRNRMACPISAARTGREGRAAIGDCSFCS